MVNEKNVNGRTPEVKADTANATAADGDGNVDAPAPESWINYVDADRTPQRVPVWRYRQLGL